MSTPTQEYALSYAGVSLGAATARRITDLHHEEHTFETGYVEFEFVTSASTEVAFGAELDTIRNAFRTPRQDIVLVQGSTTILSRKHSDNTGLDTFPTIIKDGDPADTGRSRHFRIRIEYGLPADVTGTGFRRWSTVGVEYAPSRRRTATISGTYTANSTDGTTTSSAQYLAQIAAYASTVTSGIDASAVWEKIAENFTRGETNKITDFVQVWREIIFNQSLAGLNDSAIVDPQLIITRENEAPGDSAAISFLGGTGSTFSTGANGVNTGVLEPAKQPGQNLSSVIRPTILNVSYNCSIDYTVTTNLKGKWDGTIRPFLIQTAASIIGAGIIVLEEKPAFGDLYDNRLSATMKLMAINTSVLRRKVTAKDSISVGKTLVPVWDGDPYSYYEFQGPRVRIRTVTEETDEIVVETDPNKIIESKKIESAVGTGLIGGDSWLMVNRSPEAVSLSTGRSGGRIVNIATITIETVLQFRNKKSPSIANAGGITGSQVTGR